MANTVAAVTFSLNSAAMIIATITGYTNSSVDAMPTSIWLKLMYSDDDDEPISMPNATSVISSRRVRANDLRCTSIITASMSAAIPKR